MLLALPLAAMFTACDKTDDLSKESPEVRFIDASGDYAETLTFAFDATGSQTIKIRANRAWTVENRGSSWIEVNPSSGKANDKAQTIEIIMRSDNTGDNARQADVTFRAGSGRSAVLTVIQQANEENREYQSIAHLISLMGSSTEYTVTESFWVRGTVVNDPQLLNAGLADKSVYVVDQDGESGINFITVDSGHGLTRGDIIAVQVTGLKLQFFQEALQADGLANDKFEKVSGGNPIPYKTATIEQLNGGAYQSMAVQIENVQFLESQIGTAFINSTRNLEDIDGNILAVYTNSRATPLAGEVVPEGSGTMYGVVGRYGSTVQLYITAKSDYAGLTGERFGSGGDDFGEPVTLPYTVDFDDTTDFVATTEYNHDYVVFFGPEGRRWGTYFGTVSTTGYIEGGQSMQMRWYTSSQDKMGYTYTHFELENLSKVNFKALQTNGLKVLVSHSTDKGVTWSAGQEFTPATTAGDFTYDVSATGVTAAVRWLVVLPASAPTATSRITIDNVEFLAPGQVSPPEFNVSETPRSIGSAGGNVTIPVTANVNWTATITQGNSYVTSMSPDTGSASDNIVVAVAANETTSERTIAVNIATDNTEVSRNNYTVIITQSAAGQSETNLLLNNSFENFDNATPDSWTVSGGAASKITTNAQDGNNAIQISGSGGRCDLKQEVAIEGGATYRVSFWYRDNTKGNATQGIRIWSSLQNSGGTTISLTSGSALQQALQPTTTFEVANVWTQYTADITVPTDAVKMTFEIRATSGYLGIIDNCSVSKQ